MTDAIRTYAENKTAKLTKYYSGVQLITINITKVNPNHVSEYDAELVIDIQKGNDFVSHAKAADAYAAIDLVVEKGERQLRDFKEKLQG
ncbi:MAG: ribosome-associated translation inhibitor RaiA [Planctomycetes bacterium]|nr:ribosome-associated translation inhibitor RaiA [Planctomycetota bacterium]